MQVQNGRQQVQRGGASNASAKRAPASAERRRKQCKCKTGASKCREAQAMQVQNGRQQVQRGASNVSAERRRKQCGCREEAQAMWVQRGGASNVSASAYLIQTADRLLISVIVPVALASIPGGALAPPDLSNGGKALVLPLNQKSSMVPYLRRRKAKGRRR
jgi:hypothetical protein